MNYPITSQFIDSERARRQAAEAVAPEFHVSDRAIWHVTKHGLRYFHRERGSVPTSSQDWTIYDGHSQETKWMKEAGYRAS